jgi:hypothetical protein
MIVAYIKSDSIKDCFSKNFQMQKNKVDNGKLIGEENESNLMFSSKEIGQLFETCPQITEQTLSVINQMIGYDSDTSDDE